MRRKRIPLLKLWGIKKDTHFMNDSKQVSQPDNNVQDNDDQQIKVISSIPGDYVDVEAWREQV